MSIRPIKPSDARGLEELFDSLSEDDRYFRFFAGHGPPKRFLREMTSVEERGGVGLVAVLEEANGVSRIVGEASSGPLPNGNGELGITVAHEARGWLGPYLLDVLVSEAALRGVPNVEAQVLIENRRMLSMLRRRGMAYVDHDDPVIAHVVIGAASTMPGWPPVDERPRVLVEVPGGHWHAEEAAKSAGFQVLTCPGPLPGWSDCPALHEGRCPLVAGADVVVHAMSDETGERVYETNRRLFPSIPVCLDVREGGPGGRAEVDAGDGGGGEAVIGLVQRLAKGATGGSRP